MSIDFRLFAKYPSIEKVDTFKRKIDAERFIVDNLKKYDGELGFMRIYSDSDDEDGWIVVRATQAGAMDELVVDVEKLGGFIDVHRMRGKPDESIDKIIDGLLNG